MANDRHEESKRSTAPGIIDAGLVYTLKEFQRRTQLGDAALRTARRNGLIVRYVGGRAFVAGSDFLQYLHTMNASD